MPVNYPSSELNYSPPGESLGIPDYGKAITEGLQGYMNVNKARYQKPMQEAEMQLKQGEVGMLPYKRRLMEAQIQHYLRPPQEALSNYAKAVRDAENIKKQYGADSPEAKGAMDYLTRLAQGTGMQLSVDPQTGAVNFSQGTQRGAPATQIVDGKLIQAPTTPMRTSAQKGSLANVIREDMAQFMNQPYVGTGANPKMLYDRILYSTTSDPKVKAELGDKLVNAAVAAKLAPEYALAQLLAQGTPTTVPAIHEQSKAIKQGWGEGLDMLVNNLPKELQERAKIKHDQAIESLNKKRSQFLAEGMPYELEKKGEQKQDIVQTKELNGKKYFKNSKGEWFEE